MKADQEGQMRLPANARRFRVFPMLLVFLTCFPPARGYPGEPDKKAGGDPMVLVSKKELADMEARLMAEIEENRTRKCIRPLLRGDKPLPGRADEKIIAVVESDRFSPCFEHVKEHFEKIREFLDAADRKETPEIVKLEQLCSELPDAISSAVRHEDACSPYLAGRRGLPALTSVIQGAKAVSVLMDRLASRGRLEQAFNLGLDFLLLLQDLNRGEAAPLIVAMVGVAATRTVSDKGLRPILNREGTLPEELLGRLQTELQTLIQGEPGFASVLVYERQGFVLQMFLPYIKGKEWIPPGGFDTGYEPQFEGGAGAELEGISQEQQFALAWMAADAGHRRLHAACASGILAVDCYRAMQAEGKKMAEEAEEGGFWKAVQVMTSADPAGEIRKWMLGILRAIAAPAFSKYAVRYSHRTFFMRAMQLHAAIRQEHTMTGKCPSLEQIGTGELKSFTIDPASNKPLRISSAHQGMYIVQPSQTFPGAHPDDYSALMYQLSCPAQVK